MVLGSHVSAEAIEEVSVETLVILNESPSDQRKKQCDCRNDV